jgi:glutathione S-transferase
MGPNYKLTYFDGMGRAEPMRFLFYYKNVPFEDNRIKHGDGWEAANNLKTPWGQVPILEFDGKVLAQMNAILRYLGKEYDLAGDDAFEAAKCDELVEALHDFAKEAWETYIETDEEKKKKRMEKLLTEIVPKYLTKWNDILEKNGGFLVGKRFSYADFTYATQLEFHKQSLGAEHFAKYPAVLKHIEAVHNAPGIKEWVAKRPVTPW